MQQWCAASNLAEGRRLAPERDKKYTPSKKYTQARTLKSFLPCFWMLTSPRIADCAFDAMTGAAAGAAGDRESGLEMTDKRRAAARICLVGGLSWLSVPRFTRLNFS